MERNHPPPVVLVQTWLLLMQSTESEEVRERATQMLMGAFGHDLEKITEFCRFHELSPQWSKAQDSLKPHRNRQVKKAMNTPKLSVQ